MTQAANAVPGYSAITADAVTILRTLRERTDVSVTLDGFHLVHAWNTAGVCEELKRSGATVVVATLETRDGMRVDDVIAALRNGASRVEVVVIGAPGEVRDLSAAHHAVVRTLVAGDGASRDELRAIVANARPKARLRALGDRIVDDLAIDEADRNVVRYFVEYGDRHRLIKVAASELGMSEGALEERLFRITGLDAHTVRTWGRLIAAGVLLASTLWTVDKIGTELGFGGSSGLCNLMKGYTGQEPSAIRRSGGAEWLAGPFLEVCRKALAERRSSADRSGIS